MLEQGQIILIPRVGIEREGWNIDFFLKMVFVADWGKIGLPSQHGKTIQPTVKLQKMPSTRPVHRWRLSTSVISNVTKNFACFFLLRYHCKPQCAMWAQNTALDFLLSVIDISYCSIHSTKTMKKHSYEFYLFTNKNGNMIISHPIK